MKVKLKAKKDVPMIDEKHFDKTGLYCDDSMNKFFSKEVELNEYVISTNSDHFYASGWYWTFDCVDKITDFKDFNFFCRKTRKWKMFLWNSEIEEICSES